jgi:hypothetical protein
VAIGPVHGKVDAEALLDAIDEVLAEADADVGIGENLAVAHDRRHAEDAQRIASQLDADDLPAGPQRLRHGDAAVADIIAKVLRIVHAIEGCGRRPLERHERDILRPQCPPSRRRAAPPARPDRLSG